MYVGARRFAEMQAKLATHEADAGTWRDTLIGYWKEFSGREIPVDGGPLSAQIVVGGRVRGGFDLGASSYTIPVAAGGLAGYAGRLRDDLGPCRREQRRRHIDLHREPRPEPHG